MVQASAFQESRYPSPRPASSVTVDVQREACARASWTRGTVAYPKKALLDLALTQKGFAAIGEAVVMRLIATTFPPKPRAASRKASRTR
jgi:hypothetical protein